MKKLIIPNRELRLLVSQIQNFESGYTVAQIRSLDKVVSTINLVLNPFELGLKMAVAARKDKDGEKHLEEYLNNEGLKEVDVLLDEPDFEFLKLVWSKMAGLSGSPEARKSIIDIDNAINSVTEPVFSKAD